MATKPTIHKARIALTDLDRNHYESLDLTVALHPSETTERMCARIVAYCINAAEGITFTTGISTRDEPDIQLTSLDNRMLAWIDVGEPSPDRLKKASRLAERVRVYSFNSKSDVWWNKTRPKLNTLGVVEVFQMPWAQIQAASALVKRTMDWSMMISEGAAFVTADNGDCEVAWRLLG